VGTKTIQKCKKIVTIVTLLNLLSIPTIKIYADTVEDLYNFYNISLTDSEPDEAVDIVTRYDKAKRYVAMYQYVADSNFDKKIIEDRVATLEERLEDITKALNNGYYLSASDIYRLEDEYVTCSKRLSESKKALSNKSVDIKDSVPSNVPSYEEYITAKKELSLYDYSADIGDLKFISYPVSGAALVKDITDESITLSVKEGSDILSLFNGIVVGVTEDSVTIQHSKNVYSLYKNLKSNKVVLGDKVTQGEIVGKSNNTLFLKLKIEDSLVNISELFKED